MFDFITLLTPLAVYLATELVRKYSSWLKQNGVFTITLIVPALSAAAAYLAQIINPSVGFWEQTAYGLLAVFVNEIVKHIKTISAGPLVLIIMFLPLFSCSANEIVKQQEITVAPKTITADITAVDLGSFVQGLQTRGITVPDADGKKKAQSTPLLMCAIIQLKSELQLKQNRTQYGLLLQTRLSRQLQTLRKFPIGRSSDICSSARSYLLFLC